MMLKAIKRALSLCRFCWFNDLLDEIHKLFDNTTEVHEAEIRTTKALIERIKSKEIIFSGMESEDLDWKLRELVADTASKKVKQDRHFPKGFDLEARDIIEKVRDRISDLSKGSLVDA